MRPLIALLLIGAFTLAVAPVAQGACIPIHCRNTTSGWTPQVGQYVQFINAPSANNADDCYARTMDNKYLDCGVSSSCGSGSLATVVVYSENSSLNGKTVKITQVDGDCFKICDVCP